MNLSPKDQVELLDLIAYGAIFSIPAEFYQPDKINEPLQPIADRLGLKVPNVGDEVTYFITSSQKRVERWRRENL